MPLVIFIKHTIASIKNLALSLSIPPELLLFLALQGSRAHGCSLMPRHPMVKTAAEITFTFALFEGLVRALGAPRILKDTQMPIALKLKV